MMASEDKDMIRVSEELLIRRAGRDDLDDLYEIYGSDDTCRCLLCEPWNEKTKEIEFRKRMKLNEEDGSAFLCVIYQSHQHAVRLEKA